MYVAEGYRTVAQEETPSSREEGMNNEIKGLKR